MGTEYYIIAKRLSDNNIVSVFNLGKMSGGQYQSDLYNAAISANTEEAGKQLRASLAALTPTVTPMCAVAFLMERAERLIELLAFINKHCYCTNEYSIHMLDFEQLIASLNLNVGPDNWSWDTLPYFN
jgi:hypothetical protein